MAFPRIARGLPSLLLSIFAGWTLLPVAAGSLFWRVEGPGGVSYLYGTIHLPDPRVNELPAAVIDRLKAVDGLWTEIPMETAAGPQILASMMLPDGGRLRDLLTEDERVRLERVLRELHPSMTPLMFDQYKPLWALALMTLFPSQLEHPLELPLDTRIWQEAVRMGKEVGSIEAIEEQIAVFDSFSIEEQTEIFRLNLIDYENRLDGKGAGPVEALIEAYQTGDSEEIQGLFGEVYGAESEVYEQFFERLLYERNRKFAERIAERIKKGDRWMFAFGAGHLGGPEGVESLLREYGFSVSPVME